MPSLAGASAEAIDGRTLRFLLKKSLALKGRQVEEEELKREFLDLVGLPNPLTPLQQARTQELADILESEE